MSIHAAETALYAPAGALASAEIAAMLAGMSPVAAEQSAYAELYALGLTGGAITGGAPLDALHLEAVIPTPDGFKIARHEPDQRGATRAFLFGVRDELGEPVDIAAWRREEPLARLWRGEVAMLGAERLFAPRLQPLFVFPTTLDWLRASREGIVLLDDVNAAPLLDGVTLAAPGLAFARQLRARLAPHTRRPPRIMIPTAAHG